MDRGLLIRFLDEWDRVSEINPTHHHNTCLPCIRDYGFDSLYDLLRAVVGADKTICPGCGNALKSGDWECKGCDWENPDGFIPSVSQIMDLETFRAKDVDLPAFLRGFLNHNPERLLREDDLYAENPISDQDD